MNYTIIFTKKVPKEQFILKEDEFIIFSELDENAESDFIALQSLIESSEDKRSTDVDQCSN